MVSFCFNIYHLFNAVLAGMKNDQEFRILFLFLFLFLFSILTGSTIFYSNVEGWSSIDALYFSVMTMSTIGYGDFVPTTDNSKIFTIIFTFLSVGLFVSINTKIVIITVDQKKAKMLKQTKKG